MNGGPSGFNNAPVTRALVIACALFTIVFGIQGRSSNLGWSYQDIFKKLQLWKLIVSVFAFSSTPELIFGAYLLYYFRVFERQIGSNKYSFPDFIASFFSRLSWPSTGSTSSPAPRNALGNVPSYASRQVEGNYAAPLSSAVEPPEESITTLVSMGFDRNSARQALIRARNDVNAATNLLLESQ
nr:rhomboid-like protein 20 [Ipomoea batatas]